MSVSIQPTVSQADYAALHTGALLQTRPTHGLLQVSDKDRADFLHRMSTNNINAMHPGQAAVTVLTSPTARNLFAFTVVAQEDVLLLLPAAARTAALARHLRGQIFFMDAVVVRDQSEEYARLRIMGPKSAAVVAALGITFGPDDDTALEPITGTWRAADGILAVAQTDFDVPGIELVVPTEQLDQTIATLTAVGAVPAEADDAYTARRVELGRPLPGYEVIDAYNPLEAGLEVYACPPGKKPQALTALSGGERALTAVALLFAAFLTNPAPICVLDEVDAPLDDANVTRFWDLLDEMTRRTETRFLIITHHAVTMARMDRLFGVTMAEQGVSQLVSVDLKRAEAMVA